MKKKLRIGILNERDTVPAWTYKMLERIVESENLEIVLVIKNNLIPGKPESSIKKIWKNKDKLLWILYSKFENKLYQPKPNAFEQKNIQDIIQCDILNVLINHFHGVDSLDNDDINKIKSYNLDVLINLCFVSLSAAILNIPKFGVWSYCHSDRSVFRGGAPGAWEVFKEHDKIGLILEILSDKLDGGVRLVTSQSATEKLSVNRTKNASYWKGLSFIPRKLEELFQLGEAKFFKKIVNENNVPEFYDNRAFIDPTNLEMIHFFSKIYSKKIWNTIKGNFYFGQWILLLKFEKENKWSTVFNEFKRIVPPKDRFWADPFIWKRDGRYYIFLEELVYSEKLGKISVIEINENGEHGAPQVVLERPYHLSYPFLIEENGELFMIPETAGNRTIELYRCRNFPLQWELHKTLMKDVYAVDSTIIKYNDKYWLFCNIRENEGASSLDELFLFYSDILITCEWKAHPSNPIISDVSKSRPAGNIFISNGILYRPSQNSAKGYGHGMKINEIIELSTTVYKEKTVKSIYPKWNRDLISTHTLNNLDKLTVIDALVRTRR